MVVKGRRWEGEKEELRRVGIIQAVSLDGGPRQLRLRESNCLVLLVPACLALTELAPPHAMCYSL